MVADGLEANYYAQGIKAGRGANRFTENVTRVRGPFREDSAPPVDAPANLLGEPDVEPGSVLVALCADL